MVSRDREDRLMHRVVSPSPQKNYRKVDRNKYNSTKTIQCRSSQNLDQIQTAQPITKSHVTETEKEASWQGQRCG